MSRPVVLRVVCDRCGNAVVGETRRGEREFEYQPRWVPDSDSWRRRAGDRIEWSDWWPLTGPPPSHHLTVDCRRHGVLTFDAEEATLAARRGSPAKPATIAAVPQ